jgi:predicted amidohydrolase
MRIAAAGCAPGELAPLVGRMAAAGVGLLVLPEHGTSDPGSAEPSDGALARRLAALSRESGVTLLVGYAERCVTGLYNAALLLDGHGICRANYRQAHLRRHDRPTWQRGQWLAIAPLAGHRLGLLIGYDVEFPEPARALALAGCDILAVLGGASDDAAVPDLVLPARARDNACWLAYAAPGRAAILGPDGRRRGGGEVAIVDLDPRARPAGEQPALLADRRPRLYAELLRLDEEPEPPL